MNHLKTFENYSTLKDNEDPNIRPKWMVFAGLGGGFGGATEQGIFTGLKREAENISYQLALEEYEGMEGLHGLRTIEEIMDEDGLSEEDAQIEYNDERESWLDYYVEPYDPNKHETETEI